MATKEQTTTTKATANTNTNNAKEDTTMATTDNKKAQDTKATTTAQATPQTVAVKELAAEFGVEGRIIRVILRKLGLRAPHLEGQGFGPHAKYEWPADSPELADIRTKIQAELTKTAQA